MYDWLEQEITEVATRGFHVVERRRQGARRLTGSPLPPSYVRFVEQFGTVRLYRKRSWYELGVVYPPVEETVGGRTWLRFGHHGSNKACFAPSMVQHGEEAPVYELDGGTARKTHESFGEWIATRARQARRTYSNRDWREIVRGATPFTPGELAIVAARRLFRWKALGFRPDGELRFQVHNGSAMRLKYLTVGVRSRDESLEGAIWLDVWAIDPGGSAVVTHPVYNGLVAREHIVVYALPDPTPEDRARYQELRTPASAVLG